LDVKERKPLGQSIIVIDFGNSDNFFNSLDIEEHDGMFLNNISNGYYSHSYEFMDSYQIESDFREGYIIYGDLNEENNEKLKTIVSLIIPEKEFLIDDEEYRIELSKRLYDLFDREMDSILSDYHSEKESEMTKTANESISKDLNDYLDSIGFADMKYYDGRDNDNLFPSVLANKMNLANFETPLNAEGGNLMTDGFGRLVYSDIIGKANKDALGWTVAKSEETLKNIFGTQELIELKALQCDGGTGHIDLYTKFIDEQTLLVAQYPNEVTAQDKQIIEDNYQALTNLKSTYNRPFRIIRVEHPTNDSGTYTDITCDQINNDARNFINGLTVNNMFIFPDYYDGYTGNKEQDDRVIAFLEKTMPGYKIIPIDSRDLSPLGGAIHCITIQIPATNPLRIWHPSVDGIQPNLNKFHIVSKITTPSGVATAKCIWKKNKGPIVRRSLRRVGPRSALQQGLQVGRLCEKGSEAS
jgi:agmatine/peptidylarginine deiminase